MQLRSFVAAFVSLGVISPARAVSLCRIKCHKWLINKGPAAPLRARFRRCSVPAAPPGILNEGVIGSLAPLERYQKMNILYIVSKLQNCLPEVPAPAPVHGSPAPIGLLTKAGEGSGDGALARPQGVKAASAALIALSGSCSFSGVSRYANWQFNSGHSFAQQKAHREVGSNTLYLRYLALSACSAVKGLLPPPYRLDHSSRTDG